MIELAVAIVSAAAMLTLGMIELRKGMRKNDIANTALHQELIDRMKVVEHKIDIHNGYATKFGNIEKSIAVIEEQVKSLKENYDK